VNFDSCGTAVERSLTEPELVRLVSVKG